MPRAGNGTYNLPPGVNPVLPGTIITSNWANTTLDDVASALTNSIAKDGQTVPIANLPMGGFRHTGVGNPSARDQYASMGFVQDGTHLRLTNVTVLGSAITAVLVGSDSSYVTGQVYQLILPSSPGANPTLSVNGGSIRFILNGSGAALAAGALTPNIPYLLIFNGANFILVNSIGEYVLLTAPDQTITGDITVTGGLISGIVSGTQSNSPTYQFRTQTALRRMRIQYQASDALEGPLNIDWWDGAAFQTKVFWRPDINRFGTVAGQGLSIDGGRFTVVEGETTIQHGTQTGGVTGNFRGEAAGGYRYSAFNTGQRRYSWGNDGSTNWTLRDETGAAVRMVLGLNGDITFGDGRLGGTGLHNHASGIAGTNPQYIGSGTYTPTFTGVANINTVTGPLVAQYTRVGNVVTVSGRVDFSTNAAANTLTQLAISLPIPSNLASSSQLTGVGCSVINSPAEPCTVGADFTNDRAVLSFFASATAARAFLYNFMYVVV